MLEIVNVCVGKGITSPWKFEILGSRMVQHLCKSNMLTIKKDIKTLNTIWKDKNELRTGPLTFFFGGVINDGKVNRSVKSRMENFIKYSNNEENNDEMKRLIKHFEDNNMYR